MYTLLSKLEWFVEWTRMCVFFCLCEWYWCCLCWDIFFSFLDLQKRKRFNCHVAQDRWLCHKTNVFSQYVSKKQAKRVKLCKLQLKLHFLCPFQAQIRFPMTHEEECLWDRTLKMEITIYGVDIKGIEKYTDLYLCTGNALAIVHLWYIICLGFRNVFRIISIDFQIAYKYVRGSKFENAYLLHCMNSFAHCLEIWCLISC